MKSPRPVKVSLRPFSEPSSEHPRRQVHSPPRVPVIDFIYDSRSPTQSNKHENSTAIMTRAVWGAWRSPSGDTVCILDALHAFRLQLLCNAVWGAFNMGPRARRYWPGWVVQQKAPNQNNNRNALRPRTILLRPTHRLHWRGLGRRRLERCAVIWIAFARSMARALTSCKHVVRRIRMNEIVKNSRLSYAPSVS